MSPRAASRELSVSILRTTRILLSDLDPAEENLDGQSPRVWAERMLSAHPEHPHLQLFLALMELRERQGRLPERGLQLLETRVSEALESAPALPWWLPPVLPPVLLLFSTWWVPGFSETLLLHHTGGWTLSAGAGLWAVGCALSWMGRP